jgi:hypothetical protein
MAIDARVERVDVNADGSGTLFLVDRHPDIPSGQNQLRFKLAPRKVHSLQGKEIWGGSGELMLGHRKIADRAGCEWLVFVTDQDFDRAVQAYHWKTHPETR